MSKRLALAIPIVLSATALHACSGEVVVGEPGGGGQNGTGTITGTGASTSTGTGATAGTGGVITGTTGTGTATSTGTSTGTATSSSGNAWAAYCDKRAALCGGISAATCKSQDGCAHALLRDTIEPTLFQCLSTNCKEDACFSQVGSQFPPTPIGSQFGAACKQHASSCPGASDDICIATWILADPVLKQLIDCTSLGSCAQVEGCFELVTSTTFDGCDGWL